MKFPYFKFPLPQRSDFFGTSILKPIIPVEIVAGATSVRYAALIDSGADFCIFDGEIGETLDLDVRGGQRIIFGGIQAAGGFAEAFVHSLMLKVGGWEYKTAVSFSYDIAKHGYGILGQKGFFDIFVVKFDLAKEELELKERRT